MKELNKWTKIILAGEQSELSPDTKLHALSEGLLTDKWETEEEARQELCEGKINPFGNLKRSLQAYLLDHFFLVRRRYASDEQLRRSRDECFRNLAVVKILINQGRRSKAAELAESTLRQARKYEINEVIFLLAQELAMIAALNGNISERKGLESESRLAMKNLQAESEAWFLLTQIFATTSSFRQLSQIEKESFLEKLSDFLEQYQNYSSYQFRLLRFNVALLFYHFQENPAGIIQVGQDALEYYDQLPFEAGHKAYVSVLIKMIPAYIHRHDLKHIDAVISRCLDLTQPGTYNWNVLLIYKAISGFHTRQYETAEIAFEMAKDQISPNLTEQWRIIEAYLYILDKLGRVQHRRRFKLGKFLNEVPIFSRDKLGANVSILVAQIFIYLINHQRGKIIDRIDALKAYAHKHLRRDYTYRSNCFIKILMQLPASRFHPVAFRRKAKPYLDRLQAEPLALGDIEIELIPYGDLWDFLLEAL